MTLLLALSLGSVVPETSWRLTIPQESLPGYKLRARIIYRFVHETDTLVKVDTVIQPKVDTVIRFDTIFTIQRDTVWRFDTTFVPFWRWFQDDMDSILRYWQWQIDGTKFNPGGNM